MKYKPNKILLQKTLKLRKQTPQNDTCVTSNKPLKKQENTQGSEELAIAGMIPLSTVDWPEKLSCVLFLQGCPWRCVYCHNHEILDPKTPGKIPYKNVIEFLEKRKNLLDAVVFSGGEATRQNTIKTAMETAKKMGYQIGLHTAGAYPKKLSQIMHLTDWIGIDIKALANDYHEVVNRQNAGTKAYESLKIVLESKKNYEVRLTVYPESVTSRKATEIAEKCYEMGVRNFALQQARQEGSPENFQAVQKGWTEEFENIAKTIENIGFTQYVIRKT